MSKVGDWLIEHEEVVGAAIDSGLMNIGCLLYTSPSPRD